MNGGTVLNKNLRLFKQALYRPFSHIVFVDNLSQQAKKLSMFSSSHVSSKNPKVLC